MPRQRRAALRHELEPDGHALRRRGCDGRRGRLHQSADALPVTPDRVDARADGLRDHDLGRFLERCGRRRHTRRRAGGLRELDEKSGIAALDAVRDRAVVDVVGGGARVQGHRGALQCLRAEPVDERARRDDERVARLDRLTPHLRHDVTVRAERRGLARARAMNEVRELPGLVAREKEPRAPHEEHLRRADARSVDLVVHDDRAGDVEADPRAAFLQLLIGAPIRLPQRASQAHLDAAGEVVVVLLLRKVGDLARDLHAGRGRSRARDLAQQIEPSLRAQLRAGLGLADDDDLGLARSHI